MNQRRRAALCISASASTVRDITTYAVNWLHPTVKCFIRFVADRPKDVNIVIEPVSRAFDRIPAKKYNRTINCYVANRAVEWPMEEGGKRAFDILIFTSCSEISFFSQHRNLYSPRNYGIVKLVVNIVLYILFVNVTPYIYGIWMHCEC